MILARQRRRFGLVSLGLALLLVRGASADVASEARFFDGLARRAFERGDYVNALDAFLQMNVITPSPHALYNIAVCAELGKKPAVAFAYYRDYLSREDPDTQRRSDATRRFTSLQKSLALVEVSSDPPGAAIYVDRKELGQYGVTPRTIVVTPGERQLIVEADGYVAQTVSVSAAAGATSKAEAGLTAKVGELLVEATPRGAAIEFLRDGKPVNGVMQRGRYVLPVGSYLVRVSAPGYIPTEARAMVREDTSSVVAVAAPAVARPTGRLLVGAGDVEADVFLDGRRVAVTPATLAVAPGDHAIEVRLGSRVFASRATVVEGRSSYVEVKLEESNR